MVAVFEQKSKIVHHLARFVTKEAIALHLNLHPNEIYRVNCWRYVIHVVAKGISTFVSYADIPPVLEVEAPTPRDILAWRKRWKKDKFKAPDFWTKFYAEKFKQAPDLNKLYSWGQLVNVIKFALSESVLEWLRSIYTQAQEYCLLDF
ncbi:MAG: hypothetical protein WBB28_17095 [Crinalium sp.]